MLAIQQICESALFILYKKKKPVTGTRGGDYRKLNEIVKPLFKFVFAR